MWYPALNNWPRWWRIWILGFGIVARIESAALPDSTVSPGLDSARIDVEKLRPASAIPKYHLEINLLNYQFKRLINMVEKGAVRWDAPIDEVFFSLDQLSTGTQFKIIAMTGGAVVFRAAINRARRELIRHKLSCIWLGVEGFSILARHPKIPVQLMFSQNIQGERGLSVFARGRRWFYGAVQTTPYYQHYSSYWYLIPQGGILWYHTQYPHCVWRAQGCFWSHQQIRAELYCQYSERWAESGHIYFRFLFNLPEAISLSPLSTWLRQRN